MYKIDLADPALRILPKLLKLQAEHNGDTVFLIDDDTHLTFAEAYTQCLALATGLSQLNLGKGDRVALYLNNCPEVVLVALAVNMLQAIWVPINTDYSGEWLADAVKRSQSKILVTNTVLQKSIDVVLTNQSQLTFEELAKFINDRAPYYFVPRYIDFVTSLPYTPTNKVQKFILRARGTNSQTWDLKQSNYRIVR